MDEHFFTEQREQSLIKTRIVSKYFSAWAKVIRATQDRYPQHAQKMAYVDLFAGPGHYKDQSKSTPLFVLETILADPDLTNRVVTLFNDKDEKNIESLKTAIRQIDGIERLRYPPEFFHEEVGDEIARMLSEIKKVPTFFFVDPWGYKGLSLNLVSSILKDWGCDCVFFFNYNRISMGLTNPKVQEHMAALFGESRLSSIQNECKDKSPKEREAIIIQSLCDSLKESGRRYILPFTFKNSDGTRTSHHLIFISKNFVGYDIMKWIMYNESTDDNRGVASFEYNPRDKFYEQGSLLDMLSRPIDELKGMLINEYKGRTIDFMTLYEEHSIDKPYYKNNYKEVLSEMFEEGTITAVNNKTGKPPRKGTFSDDMRITFGGTL